MSNILASPNQEKHLHIENYEDYDVCKRRQDEEEISALGTHNVLNMSHSLRKVLNITERNREQ